ncbi:flagellar FliJ family protein [Aeromonas hydrophila]
MLKQFGRVKGLELLLDKREQAQQRQLESRDQRQLDELASLRHRMMKGE